MTSPTAPCGGSTCTPCHGWRWRTYDILLTCRRLNRRIVGRGRDLFSLTRRLSRFPRAPLLLAPSPLSRAHFGKKASPSRSAKVQERRRKFPASVMRRFRHGASSKSVIKSPVSGGDAARRAPAFPTGIRLPRRRRRRHGGGGGWHGGGGFRGGGWRGGGLRGGGWGRGGYGGYGGWGYGGWGYPYYGWGWLSLLLTAGMTSLLRPGRRLFPVHRSGASTSTRATAGVGAGCAIATNEAPTEPACGPGFDSIRRKSGGRGGEWPPPRGVKRRPLHAGQGRAAERAGFWSPCARAGSPGRPFRLSRGKTGKHSNAPSRPLVAASRSSSASAR